MNIKLTIDDLPKLMEIRNDISDSIREQLNNYFPVDSLKNFNVLNPQQFPVEESLIPEYGELEIGSLAKVLNVDVPSAISEWNTLKHIIYHHTKKCAYLQSSSDVFWRFFLKQPEVAALKTLSSLIKKVLVLPIGSSEAER